MFSSVRCGRQKDRGQLPGSMVHVLRLMGDYQSQGTMTGQNLRLPSFSEIPMIAKNGTYESQTLTPRNGQPRAISAWVLPQTNWYNPIQTVMGFFVALILFTLALPVILLGALLVKLSSPGPAFYSQTRVGRNGRRFTIYKLRSMRHDCEKHSGPQWSTAGDSRITPMGRFLRRTHIDELPQFWNVLRGEMAIVGPRPERPEFIPQLSEALPLYRARLLVRPGVTGLAQVQLPPDTDLESVRRKLTYDLYYIQHRHFWLDLKLFVSTGLHVLGVPYSILAKGVSLPGEKEVEQEYHELAQANEAAAAPQADSAVDSLKLTNAELAACPS
jgi:lipopolysaccharide/colanic/teichoic acid biosynthesis glycosyltransferase